MNLHTVFFSDPHFAPLHRGVENAAEPIPLAEPGSRLDTFFQWVDASGFTGVTALVGVFVLASLLVAPISLPMVAAGWIWGLGQGYAVMAVATFIASTAAYWISQKVGRKRLVAHFGESPKFASIDHAISHEGAKVIFLLRLAPVFPYGVSNYAYGLTGVRYVPYIVATMLGMIPATLLFAYAGELHRAGVESEPEALKLAVRGLAFVALFGGFWFLGRICRRALRETEATEKPDDLDQKAEPGGGSN